MLQNADVLAASGNGAILGIPHRKRDLPHHAPCSVWSKVLHDAPVPLALMTAPISVMKNDSQPPCRSWTREASADRGRLRSTGINALRLPLLLGGITANECG